jgi:hypothetical protein
MDEISADLNYKNMKNMQFQITVFVLLSVLWLRMYMHYLGNFLGALSMGLKVEIFVPRW